MNCLFFVCIVRAHACSINYSIHCLKAARVHVRVMSMETLYYNTASRDKLTGNRPESRRRKRVEFNYWNCPVSTYTSGRFLFSVNVETVDECFVVFFLRGWGFFSVYSRIIDFRTSRGASFVPRSAQTAGSVFIEFSRNRVVREKRFSTGRSTVRAVVYGSLNLRRSHGWMIVLAGWRPFGR